eukprot:COSAG06_NODE_32614_length_503_cov_0.861386_1_plen_29_part_10
MRRAQAGQPSACTRARTATQRASVRVRHT